MRGFLPATPACFAMSREDRPPSWGVANDRRASNNAHRGDRLGGVATMFTTLAFSLMAVGLTLVVIGDALWGYFQAR